MCLCNIKEYENFFLQKTHINRRLSIHSLRRCRIKEYLTLYLKLNNISKQIVNDLKKIKIIKEIKKAHTLREKTYRKSSKYPKISNVFY